MRSYIFHDDHLDPEWHNAFIKHQESYEFIHLKECNTQLLKEVIATADGFFIASTPFYQNQWLVLSSFLAGLSFASQKPMAFLGPQADSIAGHHHFPVLQTPDFLDNYLSLQKTAHKPKTADTERNFSFIDDDFLKEMLIYAVSTDNALTAKKLLERGLSGNLVNKKGDSLLITALRRKNISLANLLLDFDTDPNSPAANGNSALMEAVGLNDEGLFDRLMDKDTDVNHHNLNGQTALILAASLGRSSMVQKLLDHHSDTDDKDSLGMTALKYAELFKHQDIIILLTQKTIF